MNLAACHILIVGEPGAGKTQLAQRAALVPPRVLILDPMSEYDVGGLVTDDFQDAAHAFLAMPDDGVLVYRPWLTPDFEMRCMLEFARSMQEREGARPLAIVVEEASMMSETNQRMWPEALELYRKGRHFQVSMVTVLQTDTDVHRAVRRTAHRWVTLRAPQHSLALERVFPPDQVQQLEILTPDTVPAENVHYLSRPAGDVFDALAAATGGDPRAGRIALAHTAILTD